jgi:uncharacterized membrane protein HdeD (DUF308 family)
MAAPFVAGIATKVALGWLIVLGGVDLAWEFVGPGSVWRRLPVLVAGLLAIGCGMLILIPSNVEWTFLKISCAVFLFAHGLARAILAVWLRLVRGWPFLMIGGVIGVGLGALMLLEVPGTGMKAVGLLIGANMLTNGLAAIAAVSRGGLRDERAEVASTPE